MFKLHRQNNKSSKSGESVDFRFSNFQALQVPKGWDRLFLSMISVESGKTAAKLGKALVRSGNCQWSETLLESVWISKDEPEECLFKFVVSMGSSRAGILGEATINMSCYMSSRVSSSVLLPLRKCSYGTQLQVKIQCLTPRPNIRHGSSKYSSFQGKDEDEDYHDVSCKPDTSDNSLVRGSTVSPTRDLDVTSHQRNHHSKELSFSETGSNPISNCAEDSTKRDPSIMNNDSNSNRYSTHQRHTGTSSKSSSPHDNYPLDDCSLSSQSSCNSGVMNSKMDLQSSGKESGAASPTNAGSKHLLEAAESTIEELRVEAKMWERNARKLMLDLDMLRNEFLDQSKKQADLVMELSAAYTEHGGLKKEIEELKLMLEESTAKQRAFEDSTFQSEGQAQIQKELASELKYQQQSNANLSLQLKRSQESNIELVSILQELEQTIEQQKLEIENRSTLQLKYTDTENSVEQSLEENRNLLLQLQQLQQSEKTLESNVQHLQKALKEKTNELEKERSLNRQSLLDVEREYKYQLCIKDEEIAKLEEKMPKSVTGRLLEGMIQTNGSDTDLIKEIETLREKVHELERDCNELTDENFELLLTIKESKSTRIEKCASFSSASSELPTKSVSAQSDVSDSEYQMYDLELKTKMNVGEQWATCQTSELLSELLKQLEMAFHHLMKPLSNISSDVSEKCKFHIDDLVNLIKKDSPNSKTLTESIVNSFFELNKLLEDRIAEFEQIFKCGEIEIQRRNDAIAEAHKNLEDNILMVQQHESSKAELAADCENLLKELSQKRSEIDKLKADWLMKEEQTSFHMQCQRELEIQIADLQTEKDQLEMNNEAAQREHNVTSKCLDDLQNDLAKLSSSLDSHISAKETLERKSAELEKEKQKSENKIILLEEENLQLQESIAVMNVQMRHLGEEKESFQSELKNSKSLEMNLQGQIRSLEIEMEANMANLNKNLEDTQDQLLEAQRHCQCLSTENQDLQASALRLTEECKILQKFNKELKKTELELHERCEQMAVQLEKSEKRFSDCSKKVEALEENLSSMLEAFSLKEKSLNSELDAHAQEYMKEKEKLIRQENLANQMHLVMSAEVNNLQTEVESLMKQISAAHEEKEKLESEASRETSILHAVKEKLESALQEIQSKLELSESELITTREESELKVQSVTIDLAASKQSHAILMADHEKLLKQLTSYRTAEAKHKTAVNNLELKLTVSDYENQQLREENADKRIHFQKIDDLLNEVSVLKSKVEECSFEKEKLEALYQTLSGDYEDLKVEKVSCAEKVLGLQEEIIKYENCKQKAIALEGKLLQLEGTLLAKETLSAQNAALENELNEVRKANKQYQQKIYQLEEDNSKCLQKAQALEMDGKGLNKYVAHDGIPRPIEVTHDLAEALKADNMNKIQLQSFSSEELKSGADYSKKLAIDGQAVAKERYERTKSSLETELRDLRQRYLQMSLKYAEVEAQREDLVMKLKAAKSGKRWF